MAMKKTLLFSFIILLFSSSKADDFSRHEIHGIVGLGIVAKGERAFATNLRYISNFNKYFGLGSEMMFASHYGEFRTHDRLGASIFARGTFFKMFYADFGYVVSNRISSSRLQSVSDGQSSNLLAIGFKMPITGSLKFEAQYRKLNILNRSFYNSFVYVGLSIGL